MNLLASTKDVDLSLKVILGIISLKLFVYFVDNFLLFLANEMFYVFYKICGLLIISYLFLYLRKVKKMTIPLYPYIMIAIGILFMVITHFLTIRPDHEHMSLLEIELYTLLVDTSPIFFLFTGQLILSIFMIRKNLSRPAKRLISLIGIAYIFDMVYITIIAILRVFAVDWSSIAVADLIYITPLIATFIFFIDEYRSLSKNEPAPVEEKEELTVG